MTSPPRLPWLPFYGTDFYEDEAVRLLSLEEEAVYLRLLWHQWREGSLPAGEAELCKISGKRSISAALLALVPVSDDTRRRNAKLERVRAEHLHVLERKAAGGRKTQAKRRPPTWLTAFAEAWQERCGAPPSYPKLGQALKGPVEDVGADVLLGRWTWYLKVTNTQYLSAHRFAETHGLYAETSRKPAELDEYERMARQAETAGA